VLIVSAAYGITDRLVNAVNNFQNIDVRNFLRELYDLHASLLEVTNDGNSYEITEELKELENRVFELERIFDAVKSLHKVPNFAKDLIISYGETS